MVTKPRKLGWTLIFAAPLYLDVIDLHPAAVCRCQGGGELDLLGQLAPLPAVRFGALNLKGTHQRY